MGVCHFCNKIPCLESEKNWFSLQFYPNFHKNLVVSPVFYCISWFYPGSCIIYDLFLKFWLQNFRWTFVKYPLWGFLSLGSNLKIQSWMREKNPSKALPLLLLFIYLFDTRIFKLDPGFILVFSLHDLSDSRLCSGFKDLELIKSGRESLHSPTSSAGKERCWKIKTPEKKSIRRDAKCAIQWGKKTHSN